MLGGLATNTDLGSVVEGSLVHRGGGTCEIGVLGISAAGGGQRCGDRGAYADEKRAKGKKSREMLQSDLDQHACSLSMTW